jgi:hypothetical protein
MRVLSTAASSVRHTTGALFEALLVLLVVAALALGAAALGGSAPGGADPVLAARGGSSIWIEGASARTADGGLQYGDDVTFGYRSDSAQSIQLQCYQGTLVFAASRMLSAGDTSFALGPSLAWTGGAADCSGKLGHRSKSGRYVVEAHVDFAVAP